MEHGSGNKAYVTMLLIGLNVLFFLYLEIAGSSEDVYFMYEHGALFAPAVTEQGEYYRLVTAMFMHFGIHHIMNNMIVLFAIGDRLEQEKVIPPIPGDICPCLETVLIDTNGEDVMLQVCNE